MKAHIPEALARILLSVRTDLDELIRVPSVSADPDASADVRRTAEMTARLFSNVGTPAVEILDGVPGGQPAVLARYAAPPGAPTVLLYAHHDVVPAGDPTRWASPPFEPTERDGRLSGRGSADDKAGIAAHVAALRTYEGRPPVGVTVFVEGEEESGSHTLGDVLRRHRDQLSADVVVLADAANFELGVPALTTTLRGMADAVVEVRVLGQGAHSGVFGGAAPDALTVLCRLLATLHSEQGDVAIEGLVSAGAPGVDYPEERLRIEANILDSVQLLGTGTVAERIWAKPAVSVLAIDAPPIADGYKTLVPSACAKISLRLAPGEDPQRAQEALSRHLRQHAPWGAQVDVLPGDTALPVTIDARGPAFDAARAALHQAYGRAPVEIGIGGDIPFIAEFASSFPEAALLVISPGHDPNSRIHGTDESLDLTDFTRACLAEALLLTELSHHLAVIPTEPAPATPSNDPPVTDKNPWADPSPT